MKTAAPKSSLKQKAVLYSDIDELLTLEGVRQKSGRRVLESDLGLIKNAALIIQDSKIIWTGKKAQIPRALVRQIKKEVSLSAATVMPGFVECHTHTVFAGNRCEEFELRNQGMSYQEIAARGGGILSTMKSTRSASPQALLELAQKRVDQFVGQGVTTLETKSGYGLSAKSELKILEVHKKLKGPKLISTFLGAHAISPEFKNEIEHLAEMTKMLELIAKKKLASRVDIFIEKGFFSTTTAKSYLEKAKSLGFQIVIHADQLSLSGGTALAVDLGAQSADHVIQISDSEILKIASSQTTAVCLPAADFYMRCAYPPARKLIEAGARVALATDFNPGSSPTQSVSLVGVLARLEMKMTLAEVIAAMTYNAAAALGLESSNGSLSLGCEADFICLNDSWRNLFYSVGSHPVTSVYKSGRKLFSI